MNYLETLIIGIVASLIATLIIFLIKKYKEEVLEWIKAICIFGVVVAIVIYLIDKYIFR